MKCHFQWIIVRTFMRDVKFEFNVNENRKYGIELFNAQKVMRDWFGQDDGVILLDVGFRDKRIFLSYDDSIQELKFVRMSSQIVETEKRLV